MGTNSNTKTVTKKGRPPDRTPHHHNSQAFKNSTQNHGQRRLIRKLLTVLCDKIAFKTQGEKAEYRSYSGIICSLSASPSSSILGFDGACPAPEACFFLIPLTISSILKSMQAASMAVLNVCAFTLYASQI